MTLFCNVQKIWLKLGSAQQTLSLLFHGLSKFSSSSVGLQQLRSLSSESQHKMTKKNHVKHVFDIISTRGFKYIMIDLKVMQFVCNQQICPSAEVHRVGSATNWATPYSCDSGCKIKSSHKDGCKPTSCSNVAS